MRLALISLLIISCDHLDDQRTLPDQPTTESGPNPCDDIFRTIVRIGIDAYDSDSSTTPLKELGHSDYGFSETWIRDTLQITVDTVAANCINLWIQVYSPYDSGYAVMDCVTLLINDCSVSRPEFACDTIIPESTWYGEWFYDGDPYNPGDDSTNHHFGSDYLSLVSHPPWGNAIQITVPDSAYSSSAFLWNKIPASYGNIVRFSVYVHTDFATHRRDTLYSPSY